MKKFPIKKYTTFERNREKAKEKQKSLPRPCNVKRLENFEKKKKRENYTLFFSLVLYFWSKKVRRNDKIVAQLRILYLPHSSWKLKVERSFKIDYPDLSYQIPLLFAVKNSITSPKTVPSRNFCLPLKFGFYLWFQNRKYTNKSCNVKRKKRNGWNISVPKNN